MTYFTLKNQIISKLKEYPETRDNDNALIAHILMDMEFLKLKKLSAEQFLVNLMEGEYGSIESITRCRRALQEKNEDLRGELWKERHGYQETVKSQLKFEF